MKKFLPLLLIFTTYALSSQSIVELDKTDNVLTTSKKFEGLPKNVSSYKGGQISQYFSFYDLAIQWANSSTYGNFVGPMMPDTTTTIYWYDGTETSILKYGFTGVGALYDFSMPFWDNPFDDGDMVTVDSIFIAGRYGINNGSQKDTLRVHIFKADTLSANSGLYGGIGFVSPLDFLNPWTMKYQGDTAQGNKGNITVPNTTVIDYLMSISDSSNTTHAIHIPGGFQLSAGETFGMYFEFIPGSYGFNDTVRLNTNDGTTNNFNVYFSSDQEEPQTGQFWTYYQETHMMTNLFAYGENRYGSFTGGQSFLNNYLLPSSRRMLAMSVHATGQSSFNIEDDILSSVTIFPNPSNGVVNIELDKTASAMVTVVDVLGQLVYASSESFTAGERKTIDLSNNAKGMYILSVEGEGVNTVERITIK